MLGPPVWVSNHSSPCGGQAERGTSFYQYTYNNAWGQSEKQQPQIFPGSQYVCLKGQWGTISLQSIMANFGQASKREAGRGLGEQRFIVVLWRTRVTPVSWRDSWREGGGFQVPTRKAWHGSTVMAVRKGDRGDSEFFLRSSPSTLGSPHPLILWSCKATLV